MRRQEGRSDSCQPLTSNTYREPSLVGQTFAKRTERENERLVTLDRFSQMSPECWRHQSDWRAFNNYIYLPYCSHDLHRLKREQEQICELDGL